MRKLRISHIKDLFPEGTKFFIDGREVEDEDEPIGKGQTITQQLPEPAWYPFEKGEQLVCKMNRFLQTSEDGDCLDFEDMNHYAGQAIINLMRQIEIRCEKRAWRNDGLESDFPHLFRQLEAYQEIRNCFAHNEGNLEKTGQEKPKGAQVIHDFMRDNERGLVMTYDVGNPFDESRQRPLQPLFSLNGAILNVSNNHAIWQVHQACMHYLILKGVIVPAERD